MINLQILKKTHMILLFAQSIFKKNEIANVSKMRKRSYFFCTSARSSEFFLAGYQ